MELNFTLDQWAELGVAAGMLITGLATLVISLWLGNKAIYQTKQLFMLLRRHEKEIIRHVDEPTDLLPRLVERYTGLSPEVTSVFLTALVKTLLHRLDVPPQEVRLDETAK